MDNIKIGFGEVGWENVDWIHLAQKGQVMDSCEHGNVHRVP